ncbi:MAG: DNA repair exonuclease [Clostridia bacterium]|nr:DNA repair exonuclease [Clostridia bacterium]
MKLLHTADLHIGAELSYLDNLRESRKYEVLETFRNICALCKKENVEFCLIAGDLFDSNAAAAAFAEPVLRYMAEIPDTHFLYVAGNHDPLDSASPFKNFELPKNLTVFGENYETVEFPEFKVRAMGRSFSHSSMEFCEAPQMPQDNFINLFLLHADFGAKDSSYNPITTAFVENCGADYLALGHIHKRTAVEKLGGTYLSYPGCPEGQGFDETGEKGVYVGILNKDGCRLHFAPCCARLHITKKFDLSEVQNTDEAEKLILDNLLFEFGENYDRNLYKLLLLGSCETLADINVPELLSRLSGKLYFVKIKNRLKQKLDLDLLAKEISLKGLFVGRMLEKIKAADDGDKKKLIDALYLGLDAFDGEVSYDED